MLPYHVAPNGSPPSSPEEDGGGGRGSPIGDLGFRNFAGF